VQTALAVAQTPLPALASPASPVESTVKVRAAAAGCAFLQPKTPAAARELTTRATNAARSGIAPSFARYRSFGGDRPIIPPARGLFN
jgi:hypothetical protein